MFISYLIQHIASDCVIPTSMIEIKDSYCYDFFPRPSGKLTIHDKVERIGIRAFYECTGLTGPLEIPNSVKIIGESAFSGCTGLNGVLTIPNQLNQLEPNVFYNCIGLTGQLTLPNTLKILNHSIFYNCYSLSGVLTIPNALTEIHDHVFYNCSGLTGNIVIPSTVTVIKGGPFKKCNKDLVVTATTNENIIVYEGCIYKIVNASYIVTGQICSHRTSVLKLHEKTFRIGAYAFNKCDEFKGELVLPDTLAYIEKFGFSECKGFVGPFISAVGLLDHLKYQDLYQL